ncbi:uncharacterized protein G2W53_017970 [Senna tora]|uniref:Uncharacterized protein n=1 Tax=Senna tora TaxID=362788 RepID=A0A834WPG8_9FABA|nr:uncharacterized protein G2W53_017970 [Senna tora]
MGNEMPQPPCIDSIKIRNEMPNLHAYIAFSLSLKSAEAPTFIHIDRIESFLEGFRVSGAEDPTFILIDRIELFLEGFGCRRPDPFSMIGLSHSLKVSCVGDLTFILIGVGDPTFIPIGRIKSFLEGFGSRPGDSTFIPIDGIEPFFEGFEHRIPDLRSH